MPGSETGGFDLVVPDLGPARIVDADCDPIGAKLASTGVILLVEVWETAWVLVIELSCAEVLENKLEIVDLRRPFELDLTVELEDVEDDVVGEVESVAVVDVPSEPPSFPITGRVAVGRRVVSVLMLVQPLSARARNPEA